MQIEAARDLIDAALFGGARVVGVTGGTSTPIEDLETVAARIYELAGTQARRIHARELAHAALASVAEPAYRSTSIGRRGRREAVAAGSGAGAA